MLTLNADASQAHNDGYTSGLLDIRWLITYIICAKTDPFSRDDALRNSVSLSAARTISIFCL